MAPASTRKRFSRAKSTNLAIIGCSPLTAGLLTLLLLALLFRRVLESERVGHHARSRLYARYHFLHVAGERDAGCDFYTLKSAVGHRHEDPVAVVQMQNRRSRNHG